MLAPRKAPAVRARLKRAIASLRAGDAIAGLDVLLDLWARERLVRVGDAIATLSKRVVVTPFSIGGSQNDDYLAWVERARARRPIDVRLLSETLLLASAREQVKEHFIRGRLKLLAKFPPDPRAGEMVELLDVNLPGLRRSVDLHRAIRRHCLPAIPAARALAAEVAEHLDELEQTLRTATFAAVGAPEVAQPGASSAEALLAAVLEQPGNDELRLIFADKLSEAGDPRGEFITLQFQRAAGTQSRDGAEREQALLKKYRARWLGHLGAYVVTHAVRFEKGFPAEVIARVSRVYRAREALGLPEWSTVTSIHFSDVSFFGPQMKSLKAADHVNDLGLQMLAKCEPPPPLRWLKLHPSPALCRPPPAQWKWQRPLSGLTSLTELEVVWPIINAVVWRPEPLLGALASCLPPSLRKLGLRRTRLNPVVERELTEASLRRVPAQIEELTLGEHTFDRSPGGWERRLR